MMKYLGLVLLALSGIAMVPAGDEESSPGFKVIMPPKETAECEMSMSQYIDEDDPVSGKDYIDWEDVDQAPGPVEYCGAFGPGDCEELMESNPECGHWLEGKAVEGPDWPPSEPCAAPFGWVDGTEGGCPDHDDTEGHSEGFDEELFLRGLQATHCAIDGPDSDDLYVWIYCGLLKVGELTTEGTCGACESSGGGGGN